jgi:hypothetical protein
LQARFSLVELGVGEANGFDVDESTVFVLEIVMLQWLLCMMHINILYVAHTRVAYCDDYMFFDYIHIMFHGDEICVEYHHID